MDKIWYYAESGQQIGPYSEHEMQSLLEHGKIQPETPVWKNGMANWQPVSEMTELANAVAKATAPEAQAVPADEEGAHLKLGGARHYEKVNQKDDDPNEEVLVSEMMQDAVESEKKSSKLYDRSKLGFYESIGLRSFESAFFATTLVLGGIGCLVAMSYWHAIAIGVASLWIIASGFALIVRAFLKHWAWGLAYLLVPVLGQLAYIIVDLQNAYRAVVLYIVGVAAIFAVIKAPGFEESPLYEHYEQMEQIIQREIEEQQQQMEEQRQDPMEQLEQP